MDISSFGSNPVPTNDRQATTASANALNNRAQTAKKDPKATDSELREKFQEFVGQTFFSEMIKSMRATQKEAAYFHGGRAEEIFQGQFDQVMTEQLSKSSAQSFSDPMYELFRAGRTSA